MLIALLWVGSWLQSQRVCTVPLLNSSTRQITDDVLTASAHKAKKTLERKFMAAFEGGANKVVCLILLTSISLSACRVLSSSNRKQRSHTRLLRCIVFPLFTSLSFFDKPLPRYR